MTAAAAMTATDEDGAIVRGTTGTSRYGERKRMTRFYSNDFHFNKDSR